DHKQMSDRIDQRGHSASLSRDGRWALVTRFETRIAAPDVGESYLAYAPEVRLVDAETGRVRLEMSGRGLAVLSPDGRFALTGTGDGAAADDEAEPVRKLSPQTQLWEAVTGEEVLRIPREVTAATLSPDGRTALLAQKDGTLLVADLRPQDLKQAKADSATFARLWDELGDNGASAYRAGWTLADW